MSKNSWTLQVTQDPQTKDTMVQLPAEFLAQHDWRAHDRLQYFVPYSSTELDKEGVTVVNLSKQERDMEGAPIFVVEQLVTHRVRFAVRALKRQDAIDFVMDSSNVAVEFDQNHLGNQVINAKEVTAMEYVDSFDTPRSVDGKMALVQTLPLTWGVRHLKPMGDDES